MRAATRAQTALDQVNRPVWSDSETVTQLSFEGFSDPGERVATLAIADELRGRPVLDIGVGAGRTTTLLRLLTSDYIGLDYTPEMVEAARRQHPGVDLRHGDARDLSEHASGSKAGVFFSYNGLDALGHEDRAVALGEMRRVLQEGGLLSVSTLNLEGPLWGQRPWAPGMATWQPGSLERLGPPTPRRRAVAVVRSVLEAKARARSVANWVRLDRRTLTEGDWGIGPLAAHDFGLLTHFITLPGAIDELTGHGFELVAAFAADDGRLLTRGDDVSDVEYFQLVARAVA